MYKFEWNYKNIKNQEKFENFVEDLKNDPEPVCNYEQAARLFYEGTYEGKTSYVMIELQVPTSAMCKIFEDDSDVTPWLDAYEVENMEDYDASNEIYNMWDEKEITFDNAEELMLQLAKEMCD